MLLNSQPQPRVIHKCFALDKTEIASDVYRALRDLASRVAAIAEEYAAFYQIPEKME